jgi:hypothetical protein
VDPLLLVDKDESMLVEEDEGNGAMFMNYFGNENNVKKNVRDDDNDGEYGKYVSLVN